MSAPRRVGSASAPNLSHVAGLVVSTRPADNDWGAWAKLQVESTAPVHDAEDFAAQLAGTTIEVFVPPPLVDKLTAGETFDGRMTVRAGPEGDVYALIPGR